MQGQNRDSRDKTGTAGTEQGHQVQNRNKQGQNRGIHVQSKETNSLQLFVIVFPWFVTVFDFDLFLLLSVVSLFGSYWLVPVLSCFLIIPDCPCLVPA